LRRALKALIFLAVAFNAGNTLTLPLPALFDF
jgi:hypothetical protein